MLHTGDGSTGFLFRVISFHTKQPVKKRAKATITTAAINCSIEIPRIRVSFADDDGGDDNAFNLMDSVPGFPSLVVPSIISVIGNALGSNASPSWSMLFLLVESPSAGGKVVIVAGSSLSPVTATAAFKVPLMSSLSLSSPS